MKTVRKKKEMRIYQLGSRFMMAECDQKCINLTRVYTLNSTAAYLWQLFGDQDIEIKSLSGLMYERFDANLARITEDVIRQLKEWKAMGLVEFGRGREEN